MNESGRRIVAHLVRWCLLLACLSALAACSLFGGVSFNTVINGTIDFSDKSSTDSNDLYFIWDAYQVTLARGKSYSLELWTDPSMPIHFECKQLGQDLGAWSDGDGTWDGYLSYDIPSSFQGSLSWDFYLRADYVGSDSWYNFRINEQ